MTANQIAYANYLETKRSNLAAENLRRKELDEAARSHVAGETETNRHNLVTEGLSSMDILENRRANLARETETNRANLAQETEAKRSHLANEEETRRANQAREYETNRSNLANEAIRYWSEANQQAYNQGLLNHYARMDTETARSNRVNESIAAKNANSTWNSSLAALKQAENSSRQNDINAWWYQNMLPINQQNADSNSRNAATGFINAATGSTNANANVTNASTQKQKAESDAARNTNQNWTDWLDTFIKGADVVRKFIGLGGI